MHERKEIPGFSGYYATRNGDILNQYGKRLTPYQSNGYLSVKVIRSNGTRVTTGVHRLVAAAFLGEIPPGMWVNHKNGIRDDNRIENLEIDTPQYNHLHARDVLRRQYINPRKGNVAASRFTEDTVDAMKTLSAAGWSQHRIARAFQTSQPTVHNILKGKTWKHLNSN